MTQTALVTGASSGIGQAIAQRLLEHGYEVYGIGRDFSACTLIGHAQFHTVVLDLLDTPALLAFLETLPKDNLSVLVNSAGCAWYGHQLPEYRRYDHPEPACQRSLPEYD